MSLITPSYGMSSSRCRNTTGLKDKSFLIACFFQVPLFLDIWPKPLCLCFLKSSLVPKPVPSAFPRATQTSLHVLRKHSLQSLHLEEEKDLQGTVQGTTAEWFLSHNGRFLQCLAESEASQHGSSPPATGQPRASASKGLIALQVQQTTGRKGWPTVPFTPLA